jgi:hypothetical protein
MERFAVAQSDRGCQTLSRTSLPWSSSSRRMATKGQRGCAGGIVAHITAKKLPCIPVAEQNSFNLHIFSVARI